MMTWEHFTDMLRVEYVPQVERECLATEYLSIKKTKNSMMEINKMFTERALFCPESVANEQLKMSRYPNMLKIEIREFVVNNTYKTL